MAGETGDVIRTAKNKIQAPAIAMIVTGIITLCLAAYGAVQSAAAGGKDFDTQWAEEIKKIEDDPSKKDEEKKAAIDMMNKVKDVIKPFAQFAIVFQIGSVVIGALCIFGGLRVMALKNRGLGILASVSSMIPCVSCCCLGVPVGIWLIIVLNNPMVKAGFAAVAGSPPGGPPADDLDAAFAR